MSLGSTTEWCDTDSVLFLPADAPHANYYPRATTRLHVEIAPGFWARMGGAGSGRGLAMRDPVSQELRRAALNAFSGGDSVAEFALATRIADVAAMLTGRRRSGRRNGRDRWLLLLRDYLDAHCTERLSLTAAGDVALRHPAHVAREFRGYFGMTIGEFVRRRRAVRAATLLRRTSLPLADVALQCAFCDQAHLTRVFLRYAGVTPARYRHDVGGPDRSGEVHGHDVAPVADVQTTSNQHGRRPGDPCQQ